MTTTPLSPELIDEFLALASALSPENLMADGERPMAAARRIKASLMARWRALEARVGRPVSEDEVWHAYLNRPRVSRVGMTARY